MFWVVLAVTLDQITKHLASLFLQVKYIPIFNFFYLTFATNRGIAFGLFAGVKEIVIYLSLAIIVAISLIPRYVKISQSTEKYLAFIVGGALGNLIDRIRFGYVIDFLTMKYWPTVFNVADMFIFFGSLGLILIFIKQEIKEKNSKHTTDNRREKFSGYTSYIKGKRMEIGQIRYGENTRMDIEDLHTKSDKERGSIGQWDFKEAELQGEVWGYNYLECSRGPRDTGNPT